MTTAYRDVIIRVKMEHDKASVDRTSAAVRGALQAEQRERQQNATAAERLRKQEERDEQRRSDAVLRTHQRLYREKQRLAEREARETERAAKIQEREEQRRADAVLRIHQRLYREKQREEEKAARDSARAATAQQRAVEQAQQRMRSSYQQGFESARMLTTGVTQLARSFVLLGISSEEDLKKAMQALAMFEAGAQGLSATLNIVQGLTKAMGAYRTATLAAAGANVAFGASGGGAAAGGALAAGGAGLATGIGATIGAGLAAAGSVAAAGVIVGSGVSDIAKYGGVSSRSYAGRVAEKELPFINWMDKNVGFGGAGEAAGWSPALREMRAAQQREGTAGERLAAIQHTRRTREYQAQLAGVDADTARDATSRDWALRWNSAETRQREMPGWFSTARIRDARDLQASQNFAANLGPNATDRERVMAFYGNVLSTERQAANETRRIGAGTEAFLPMRQEAQAGLTQARAALAGADRTSPAEMARYTADYQAALERVLQITTKEKETRAEMWRSQIESQTRVLAMYDQQIAKTRQEAREVRERGMSAAERFGALNPEQQQQVLNARRKMTAGADLTREEETMMTEYGATATQQDIRKRRTSRANALGFGAAFGAEYEAEARSKESIANELEARVNVKYETTVKLEADTEGLVSEVTSRVEELLREQSRLVSASLAESNERSKDEMRAEWERDASTQRGVSGR